MNDEIHKSPKQVVVIFWLEEYEKCGCSSIALKKKELLGYCAKHGGSWINRYKLRATKEEIERLIPEEDE
jgi:hypothetical protein